MTRTTSRRTIRAPRERVFQAVADVPNLAEVVPDVLRIEVLGEQSEGVGTRFRETRAMGKKEELTELEVTEYAPPARVRMVADSHGTIWDTVFTIEPAGDATELTMVMDARAHKLLPKLLNPLLKGLYAKGVESHLDAVKAWCEESAAAR